MCIGVQKKSSNAFCAFSLTFFFFPQTHSSFYNHIHSLEKYKTAQRRFDIPAFASSLPKNYQLFLYLGFSMIFFFFAGGGEKNDDASVLYYMGAQTKLGHR